LKFERRHYIAFARMLRELYLDALDRQDLFLLESVETFRNRLVETFRRDNPRFVSARFIAACQGEQPAVRSTIRRRKVSPCTS